jgi:hypothetical protein
MDKHGLTNRAIVGALGLLVLAACGDSTGVGGVGEEVSLSFRVSGAGAPAAVGAVAAPVGLAAVAGAPMVLSGSNGTLTLDEIRIIIDEVELELADDDSCGTSGSSGDDSGDDSSDDCAEFEVGPRFLDLPLDGDPVEAVTATIPAGVYSELEFEIEDLEDDEGDASKAAAIAALRAEILSEFPDWPRKASALVVGTFQPTEGDPLDFRVYMEAEVEIEMDLIPNLVVDDSGTTSRDLTVDVSPAAWFTNPDGTVIELQLFDYDATGELLELEVEMERGFTEIELDD